MALDFSFDGSDPKNPVYYAKGKQVSKADYDALQSAEGVTAEQSSMIQDGWTAEDIEAYEDQDFNEFGEPEDYENGIQYRPGLGPISGSELDVIDSRTAYANALLDAQTRRQTQITEDLQHDWRVRLHLAPNADYLYKAKDPGILAPLAKTDGIIFPYTPEISVQYNANYENYDLPHSNYRGYFYSGSQVQNILLTASFTAQDLVEANYMLAVMHFLRSATKMFYGQDTRRGMPPPVVFLTGLGEYQFNNHPCAITMMNYNIPNDVDFISAGRPITDEIPVTVTEKSTPSQVRKATLNLRELPKPPAGFEVYKKPTYLPTKLDINFTMIPIQTRKQVSEEFSLERYASGELLKKGFW